MTKDAAVDSIAVVVDLALIPVAIIVRLALFAARLVRGGRA